MESQFRIWSRYVSYRESLGPNKSTENWNIWETEIGSKSIKTTMKKKAILVMW